MGYGAGHGRSAFVAFPIAYYAARYARGRWKALFYLGIMLPLWSSYLVKVYAWKLILAKEGILTWILRKLHLSWLLDGIPRPYSSSVAICCRHQRSRHLHRLRPYLAALYDPGPTQAALSVCPAIWSRRRPISARRRRGLSEPCSCRLPCRASSPARSSPFADTWRLHQFRRSSVRRACSSDRPSPYPAGNGRHRAAGGCLLRRADRHRPPISDRQETGALMRSDRNNRASSIEACCRIGPRLPASCRSAHLRLCLDDEMVLDNGRCRVSAAMVCSDMELRQMCGHRLRSPAGWPRLRP